MTKQLTPAAQVAKLCKQYLKARGIPARVTSKNYSMGNSVRVYVTNLPPTLRKEIEAEFAKYQYGHFDGMTDCYEYSNNRDDIPQTKFLFVENDLTDDLRQAAWEFLRNRMHGYDAFPANYDEMRSGYYRAPSSNYNVSDEVYHILSGVHCFAEDFWAQKEKAAA